MKLSKLKQIIKESIKELQNKKPLLTEGCTATGPDTYTHECFCEGTGQNSTCDGSITITRYTNCNTHTSTDCGCCLGMTDPRRGGERAPQDIGM